MSIWNAELDGVISQLWHNGSSGSEIAAELKAAYRLTTTRAAVIGRLHRLGVSRARASVPAMCNIAHRRDATVIPLSNNPPRQRSVNTSTKRKPARPVNPILAEIANQPRLWETRKFGECAFPVDRIEQGIRSCCNPTGGETYCLAHQAVMYQPLAPKVPKRRAA